MVRNIFILIPLFYFFILLQVSFLVHFSLWRWVPNLILISVILLNIFSFSIKLGVGAALAGGFLLDVFSSNFIGFWILILLALAFLISFVFKKYVRIPFVQGG